MRTQIRSSLNTGRPAAGTTRETLQRSYTDVQTTSNIIFVYLHKSNEQEQVNINEVTIKIDIMS